MQAPLQSIMCRINSRSHTRWTPSHEWDPSRHQIKSASHTGLWPLNKENSRETEGWGKSDSLRLFLGEPQGVLVYLVIQTSTARLFCVKAQSAVLASRSSMLEGTVEPEAGREPVADDCRPPEHLLQMENSPPDPNSVVMQWEHIHSKKHWVLNIFFLNNRK